MAYDNLNRMTQTTDAEGKGTYDPMGRVAAVIDPFGGITSYSYALDGKLTMVTDAKNQTIRYNYDNRGRLIKMTDQLGNIETYSYDTSDNLVSMTDRKGQTTTYQYDLMNRMTRADYADGSYTAYTYDAGGRLLSVTDSITGAISYTYANGDKATGETTPLGSISYTEDAIGRRTSMTVSGQPVVNYGYDANSRLTGINTLINGSPASFGLSYDNAGRRMTLALPNGVTTNYSYDNASRLLALDVLNSMNSELETLNYSYDSNGNRTSMSRPSVTLPMPNAASNTSYNEANQMLSFNDKNIVYDNNGNMASVTNSCGTTSYTWDARNRLTGISGFKPDCSTLTSSFKYDALGRRIEKNINGTTTKYLYDGQDIIQEKNQSGTVTANYIRTLNIDEPLTRIKADGTVRHYLRDALGSVIALTDDSGVVKTTYSYDPFGNTTVSGEASDNPFQYTGRENDGTGLYYYRARYYSPEMQRFISEDPILRPMNSSCSKARGASPKLKWMISSLIKEPSNFNAYLYINNSPIKYTDPFGMWWWIPPVVYGCAVGYCNVVAFVHCLEIECGIKLPRDPNHSAPVDWKCVIKCFADGADCLWLEIPGNVM